MDQSIRQYPSEVAQLFDSEWGISPDTDTQDSHRIESDSTSYLLPRPKQPRKEGQG